MSRTGRDACCFRFTDQARGSYGPGIPMQGIRHGEEQRGKNEFTTNGIKMRIPSRMGLWPLVVAKGTS